MGSQTGAEPGRQPIRRLSPETANRIAAGEVIERPSSVVKELLENALDAGAGRIALDIREGGLERIRVGDDGVGIEPEDLAMAVEPHATSKLSSIGDLETIRTLGFRGEALASIAAVSRMEITSCTGGSEGMRLYLEGGEIAEQVPSGRPRGTSVTVRNLFYNTPARRKFMKSPAAEKRQIGQVFSAIAMANPTVGFVYTEAGRELYNLPSGQNLEERTLALLGSAVTGRMAAFERESGELAVRGLTSLPDLTRGNRSLQYLFVNGRFIRDKILSHAISQAYASVIHPGRFPAVVLFCQVPNEQIDVNVHPTKLEVRFREEQRIHRIVRDALRAALSMGDEPEERVRKAYRAFFERGVGPEESDSGAWSLRESLPLLDARRFKDPSSPPAQEVTRSDSAGFRPSDRAVSSRSIPADPLVRESAEGTDTPRWSAHESPLFWQLHNTYIFVQIQGGLALVDQHAAHERILLDVARQSLHGSKPTVQRLLFPIPLDLTIDEYEAYLSAKDYFESLGFLVEEFGGQTVLIQGIPSELRNWQEGRLLKQFLGDLVQGAYPGKETMEQLLHSYACRAAIKAGDPLTQQEMQALLDQLFATDLPFSCPHGRPAIVRLDLKDLERIFHRA